MRHPKLQKIILFEDGLSIGIRWVNDKIQLQVWVCDLASYLVKTLSQAWGKAEICRQNRLIDFSWPAEAGVYKAVLCKQSICKAPHSNVKTRGSTAAKLAFSLFSIVSSGISNPQTHWPSMATFIPHAGDCCCNRKVYHQSSPGSPVNKTPTHTQSTSLMQTTMSHLDINYSSHNWNLHCWNICCHQFTNCLSL